MTVLKGAVIVLQKTLFWRSWCFSRGCRTARRFYEMLSFEYILAPRIQVKYVCYVFDTCLFCASLGPARERISAAQVRLSDGV